MNLTFNVLNELENINIKLTENQKKVLCNVYMAATPKLAYEYTIGNDYYVTARKFLLINGFLRFSGKNKLSVTTFGRDMLINSGIISVNDELTDYGNELFDSN